MSAGDDTPADAGSGGVLGNLPRSRPGHRSDKRSEPDASAPPASERARTPRPADAEPAGGGGRGRRSAQPVAPAPSAGSEGGGPLGGAARVAGRAARAGLDVAGGVLRRLPRP